MEYVEVQDFSYFRSQILYNLGFINGFTTKKIKNLSNSSLPQDISENKVDSAMLETLRQRMNLEGYRFVLQEQIHSDNIKIINDADLKNQYTLISQNDGLITDVPRVCLMSLSADCMSLLLVHPQSGVVANAHVGRLGALLNMPVKLVTGLCREFILIPTELVAVMGTCISAQCYEVGIDVLDEMKDLDPTSLGFLFIRNSKRYFDLRGYVNYQLTSIGIKPENIDSQQLCSHCHEELFYSYRRDGAVLGRQAGFIATLDKSGS